MMRFLVNKIPGRFHTYTELRSQSSLGHSLDQSAGASRIVLTQMQGLAKDPKPHPPNGPPFDTYESCLLILYRREGWNVL